MEPIKGAKYYINKHDSVIGEYTGLQEKDLKIFIFLIEDIEDSDKLRNYGTVFSFKKMYHILKDLSPIHDYKKVAFRRFESVRSATKYYPNIELFKKLYPNGKEINNMWEVNL